MNEFADRRQWGPRPHYPRVLEYQRPDDNFIVIAGPCSVESKEQIRHLSVIAAANGATHLRGGIFRAGTYPGEYFGLIGKSLIEEYSASARAAGLENIIEVLDYSDESLDFLAKHTTCFQVGARQMQNYTLLRKLGSYGKTVFLKRHPGATLDEWLGAAEHLFAGGVKDVVLIERGSSTNANHCRWDLSISMIPAIKALSGIPVICDASHGTGRRDLVEPMALAGVAAGAAGILIEVHSDPVNSLSDPDQAVTPQDFSKLMTKVNKIREVIY